jgi:hypothetical protein
MWILRAITSRAQRASARSEAKTSRVVNMGTSRFLVGLQSNRRTTLKIQGVSAGT